jgi:hypothetical protein
VDCFTYERSRQDLIARVADTFSSMASIRPEMRPAAQGKTAQLASVWSTDAAKVDYR